MSNKSLITKDYRWKATNNAGEVAKFYMRLIYDVNSNTDAVAMTKLTLCNKRYPAIVARIGSFTLLKKFKGKFLYQEHLVLKVDTLVDITGTILEDLVKIKESQNANSIDKS